jgi:hypothetical protein
MFTYAAPAKINWRSKSGSKEVIIFSSLSKTPVDCCKQDEGFAFFVSRGSSRTNA